MSKLKDPAAEGMRAALEQNRQARLELNAAQDKAAKKIAGLLMALGDYQDRFARDLHPTWPQIGSANLIVLYLENAVRHIISTMPKGTSR